MDKFKERVSEDLGYKAPCDPTLFISESIGEVIETLFVAVLLVVFTVWLFLQNLRTTVFGGMTASIIIGVFMTPVLYVIIQTIPLADSFGGCFGRRSGG